MAEKTINSRIVNKHATESEWKAKSGFIPKQGEMIVYDVDANCSHQRFKIGDGTTTVGNLPFGGSDLQISDTQPNFACTWFKPKS